MAVFSTDVPLKNSFSSKMKSAIGKRSLSFQFLPVVSKDKMKRVRSVSENVQRNEESDLEIGEIVTSHSLEDIREFGRVNASFKVDINCYADFDTIFGGEGNLRDGADVYHLNDDKCVVTDLLNNCLMIFSKTGNSNIKVQHPDILEPWGVTEHQNIILVTSRRHRIVIKLSKSGATEESSFGSAFFAYPCGIAVTKDHRIIVSDVQAKRVSVHSWNGDWLYDLNIPDNINLQFLLPRYITVSPLGDIKVSDSGNHCIFLFSEDGVFKKCFGSYGSADHQLKAPYGVCCDCLGNIFVADHYNDQISFYSKDGDFIRNVITKHDGIFHPQGISLSSDMKLYVTHGSLKACEVKVFTLNSKALLAEENNLVYHV